MKCNQRATVLISDHSAELLYRIAEQFYKDPANVAAFEQWKAEQAKQQTKGV